jgi:hypothetical protein
MKVLLSTTLSTTALLQKYEIFLKYSFTSKMGSTAWSVVYSPQSCPNRIGLIFRVPTYKQWEWQEDTSTEGPKIEDCIHVWLFHWKRAYKCVNLSSVQEMMQITKTTSELLTALHLRIQMFWETTLHHCVSSSHCFKEMQRLLELREP